MDEFVIPFLKEHAVAIVVGIMGIGCLGYGIVSLSTAPKTSDAVVFQSRENASPAKSNPSTKPKEVMVDIAGAVEKPGVYKLESTGRVRDALIAAGGLRKDADRARVSQTVNLAAPLTDSAKLYIPFVGEQMVTSGTGSENSSGTTNNVLGSSGKMININTASESELDELTGIGPVTAQKIISNRPYQSIDDLVTKKAVGSSVFSKIKDQISVY